VGPGSARNAEQPAHGGEKRRVDHWRAAAVYVCGEFYVGNGCGCSSLIC